MNQNYPHEVINEQTLRRLPPKVRRKYVPISQATADRLKGMTPEERADYLLQHAKTDADKERLLKAAIKRARRLKRKGLS